MIVEIMRMVLLIIFAGEVFERDRFIALSKPQSLIIRSYAHQNSRL